MSQDNHASTRRKLRTAPDGVLVKTRRLYGWVGRVSYLATFTCLVLGIWADWRWLPTALLPLFAWVIAHQVDDLVEAELERRRTEASGCPDQLG